MENLEEIFTVIYKWFNESFDISINSPNDLSDGVLYLKLLKKCTEIPGLEIKDNKRENYEKIECILDDFYGCQTSSVVDYYEFLYVPSHENIIYLCILCIMFCHKYNQIPNLSAEDSKRLAYLTSPVYEFIYKKKPLTSQNFHKAIEKAKERELGELSQSSISLCKNDSFKSDSHHNGSDDEVSNASDIRSLISECSINVRSIHDSVSEFGLHDRSKDSLKRKHKINKSRRIPNIFLSPSYKRTMNSPKLNDSRKLEQRRIKTLEFENGNLKQDLCHLNDDLEKSIQNEKKFNAELNKFKAENRNLMDTIDCLNSTIEENSSFYSRKDKEFDKIRKDLEINKKKVREKDDEIKQFENSNQKLRQDIDELKIKLKNKSSQCKESMKIEVDICKEKQNLQFENEQLKLENAQIKKNLQEMQNSKYNSANRESLVVSPESIIEEGESLDIINQVKQAEMIEKFDIEKKSYESIINNLKLELQVEKLKSNNNEEFTSKLNDTSNELKTNQIKLVEKDKELNQLRESIDKLRQENKNLELVLNRENICPTNTDNVDETLKRLLFEKEFSEDEKTNILKLTAGYLNLDLSGLEKTHDLCQKELSSVYQKLKHCKEEIAEKENNLDEMHNLLYDGDEQLKICKKELSECQLGYEETKRLWQNLKSSEFKLKQTLLKVEEERKEAFDQNANLKMELLVRENQLQKSNQGFNIICGRYDESLKALHNLVKDCEDYEQVVKEATEYRRRVFRNSYCQTDKILTTNSVDNSGQVGDRMLDRGLSGDSFRRDFRRETVCDSFKKESLPNFRNEEIPFQRNLLNKSSSFHNKRVTDIREKHFVNSNQNYFDSEMETTPKYRNENFNKISTHHSTTPRYHSEMETNPKYRNENFNKISTHHSMTPRITLDPKWETFQGNLQSTTQENRKIDSPAVKPARIHQIISRNLQQPNHLKSSYPIETQSLGKGYLADCLLKEMNYNIDDPVVTDRPELTARSSSSRHYTLADPLNPSSNVKKFNYVDDSFADQLLKGTATNGFPNGIVTARSNDNHHKSETYRLPIFAPTHPTNNEPSEIYDNSDRENVRPFLEKSETFNDNQTLSSVSMKFDIPITPKRFGRRGPRGSQRNQKI